jgi:hypothetical protein
MYREIIGVTGTGDYRLLPAREPFMNHDHSLVGERVNLATQGTLAGQDNFIDQVSPMIAQQRYGLGIVNLEIRGQLV